MIRTPFFIKLHCVNCLSRILPHSHGSYSVSGYRASMTYRHFTRSSMALAKWYHLVNKTVRDYWQESLLHDAATKSTLQFVNISICTVYQESTPSLALRGSQHKGCRRARIKSKLLHDRYIYTCCNPVAPNLINWTSTQPVCCATLAQKTQNTS